ncbi:MAG: PAS domain S-box protein [Balneolaceae bacterium]|nr:PAS domain S-box protein [Balneolaceae bacterium]
MKNSEPNSKTKAKAALKAISKAASPEELAREYDVAESRIREWIAHLERKAHQLFPAEQTASKSVENISTDEDSPELRHLISLLQATLDATANGILVIDLDGKVVTYNKRFLEMWEIPESIADTGEDEKLLGYVLDQLEHPEEFLNRVKELYNRPSATSQDILRFKDGRIFERYSLPQRMGDEITGRVWSFMDVTEQRAAKEKMDRLGQLLRSINANVEEGILRSTPEEGLIYVNDAFVDIFGYDTKGEALAASPEQYYANEEKREELINKLERDGHIKNEEVRFRRKDGSEFWGLENSILVKTDGQLFIDGVVNDITDIKQVEEKLRQSEERYREIIENIEDGYFETDLAGNFTFFNESLTEILGYSADEMMGMNNREYMDEENAKEVFSAFNRVYETGISEKGFQWEVMTKEGERRVVEASISLIKTSDGERVGFRGIVRDITDRMRREEQIKASLKEKVVLLGEIHHRVKNNLAVVSGLLYMQAENTDDESARTLLQQSQNRIHSMAMIHEMLYENRSFSRIDPDQYIRRLINYIAENLDTGQKDITTEVETGKIQLDMNSAIPCALIINELLTNAYKYAFEGREKGKITVRFFQENGEFRLEVADDGIGLDEEQVRRDYEEGKGLGFFLVETLANQIDGELNIEQDNGTRFVITFPAKLA